MAKKPLKKHLLFCPYTNYKHFSFSIGNFNDKHAIFLGFLPLFPKKADCCVFSVFGRSSVFLYKRKRAARIVRRIGAVKVTPHNGARRFGQCFDPSESMKMREYFVYFPFYILHDWGKRSAEAAAPIVRCCLSPKWSGQRWELFMAKGLHKVLCWVYYDDTEW